jgi:5-methyltetrahydropteroyltriglutamate--homocysteine methyltransferase
VSEFTADQTFRLASMKVVDEYLEAKALEIDTRPVLLGPVTYLLLGKTRGEAFDPLTLLARLLPVYAEILRALADAGASWVQIDEPCLVMDLSDAARAAFGHAYDQLAKASPALRLMLTTYFGALADNLDTALVLPVHGLHIDLVRAPEQLDAVLAGARPDLVLSLGVIDGRNIWKADLNAILDRIQPVVASGRSVIVAPSCSLLHTPIDLARENALDPRSKTGWPSPCKRSPSSRCSQRRSMMGARACVTLWMLPRPLWDRVEPRARSTIPQSRCGPKPPIRRWHAGQPGSKSGGKSSVARRILACGSKSAAILFVRRELRPISKQAAH